MTVEPHGDVQRCCWGLLTEFPQSMLVGDIIGACPQGRGEPHWDGRSGLRHLAGVVLRFGAEAVSGSRARPETLHFFAAASSRGTTPLREFFGDFAQVFVTVALYFPEALSLCSWPVRSSCTPQERGVGVVAKPGPAGCLGTPRSSGSPLQTRKWQTQPTDQRREG